MKSVGAITLFRRAAVAAALAGAGAVAQAEQFSCITGSFADCALATSTLSWTWNGLDFTIANSGSGYVSEVYFDLDSGMAGSFLSGTGGNVFFYSGGNPSSLPGGTTVGFVSDATFDSDPAGITHNGIDQGETATFRITGASLDSFTAGDLGAGLHVRSLINDSVSVVTITNTNAVSEPASLAMALAGFGVLGWRSRRKPR